MLVKVINISSKTNENKRALVSTINIFNDLCLFIHADLTNWLTDEVYDNKYSEESVYKIYLND